jgi:hypothetical protein
MQMSDNQVFTVMQDVVESKFTQTALTPAFGVVLYQLSFLDQSSSFEAVFDQYRIDEIEVTFRPMFNSNFLAAPSAQIIPMLYVAVDYDDATAPTTLAYLREYSNCTMSQYETVVRRWVPHVAVAAYNGAFGGYRNETAPWIDCASDTVQHYGIKFGCDAGVNAQTLLQVWTITARLRVSFRNVH